MDRTHVTSNNIKSIGYENGVLEIAFLSGGIYQYVNVPHSVYHSIMMAPSKGKYFYQNVKDIYECRKIK